MGFSESTIKTTMDKIDAGAKFNANSTTRTAIQIIISTSIFLVGLVTLVHSVPLAVILLYLYLIANQMIYKDFVNYNVFVAYKLGQQEAVFDKPKN